MYVVELDDQWQVWVSVLVWEFGWGWNGVLVCLDSLCWVQNSQGGRGEGRGEKLEVVDLWSCDATRDVDVQQMCLVTWYLLQIWCEDGKGLDVDGAFFRVGMEEA